MIKLEKTPSGYILPIHVSAGAGSDAIRGEHDGKVKIAVTAPPQDGKANKAICDLIADKLGISGRNVRIISGKKSREKKVLIEDVPKDKLEKLFKRSRRRLCSKRIKKMKLMR